MHYMRFFTVKNDDKQLFNYNTKKSSLKQFNYFYFYFLFERWKWHYESDTVTHVTEQKKDDKLILQSKGCNTWLHFLFWLWLLFCKHKRPIATRKANQ